MSTKVSEKQVLTAVMTATFAVTFMSSSINVALPSIGYDFSCNAAMLSWIISSYLLSSAVILLPMGRISDLIGRKKVFSSGTVLFAVFTFLCGFSWSITSLIAFRVLQGLAASMIFSTGMAIISSVYPPEKRGKAMGLSITATYAGLSMGPVFGGILCQRLGWQSIFCVTAVICTIVTFYIWNNIHVDWLGEKNEKFDIIGSIIYIFALLVSLLSLSFIAKIIWAKYTLIVGILLFMAFYFYEKKYPYPILNISIFRKNTAFIFSNLAAMINYGSTYAVIFLLSLYLQIVRGYSPQTTGLILLVQSVFMAIFASKAGSLSDVIEPRILATYGIGLNTLGLFIYTFISPSTPIAFIVVLLALMGLGYALFSSPNSNAIMASVEKRHYGIASSFMATMRVVGQSLSMAIATLIISFYMGTAALGPENADLLLRVIKATFIISAVFSSFGIFASLARGNIR